MLSEHEFQSEENRIDETYAAILAAKTDEFVRKPDTIHPDRWKAMISNIRLNGIPNNMIFF